MTKHSSCAKNREEAEVIGSIREIVDGREDRDYVLEKMTSPCVHLVTLTITQGGYHLDKNFNLDIANKDIAHDLRNPSTPTTAIGFIVEALHRRRDRGMIPFTTLSCDNLPRNGEILRRAVLAYADLIEPTLAEYIRDNATFPNTVVDRIVPQEQESDYNYPSRLLQVCDRAPIVTEPFWQFIVEDNFTGDRPKWEDAGVLMTKDITPFLYMKSRFLNAVHSFIACLAVRAGIEYMHEAIGLPEFHLFTQLLMNDIAAATPVPRSLCEQYMATVLLRLSNSALPDSIERISTETSRKVGKYIFPILQDAYSRKVSMKRLILPIAAWLLAVREGASEFGKPYHVKDTLSVVTAIREGRVLSGILGLENCEHIEVVDDECHQALRDLQTHGLLTTLKNYSERGFLNETASACNGGLFDHDGTVVDSETIALESAWRLTTEVAREFAGAHVYELDDFVKSFAGKPYREILKNIYADSLTTLNERDIDRLVAEEEKRAIERLSIEAKATEGTQQVLSYLRDGGFEYALVSNSSLQRLSACLTSAALSEYFPSERIFSAQGSLPIRRPKPLPDIYLYAVKCLEAEVSDCVAVEDSISGVRSAVAAGIGEIIGYVGGTHISNDERRSRADALLSAGA